MSLYNDIQGKSNEEIVTILSAAKNIELTQAAIEARNNKDKTTLSMLGEAFNTKKKPKAPANIKLVSFIFDKDLAKLQAYLNDYEFNKESIDDAIKISLRAAMGYQFLGPLLKARAKTLGYTVSMTDMSAEDFDKVMDIYDHYPSKVNADGKTESSKIAVFTTEQRLIYAVQYNNMAAVKKYLPENSMMKISSTDKQGRTTLHYAAENKNNDMLSYLIKNGAQGTNHSDYKGFTPYHLANEAGQAKLVEKDPAVVNIPRPVQAISSIASAVKKSTNVAVDAPLTTAQAAFSYGSVIIGALLIAAGAVATATGFGAVIGVPAIVAGIGLIFAAAATPTIASALNTDKPANSVTSSKAALTFSDSAAKSSIETAAAPSAA